LKLELLDKLADENLAEIYVGRLLAPGGPQLVTVRKLLRQATNSPGMLDELRRASLWAREFQHPQLLPHLGFFEVAGDHFWLTSRTLGFDLEAAQVRLSSREVRITPLRTLQIGMDLLEVLAALHAREAVFSGLGPRQVLVGLDGVARLDALGFESALLDNKELKQKARRGRTATLAPEVVQGRPVGAQADVFSVAALLYMLLTGRSPLGEKQRGGGMSTRHVAVTPPSKIERTLPYACDAVFIKALGVAPSGRHADAASLGSSIASLRSSLLQGFDEGRAGVKDFIENLFPNEASVMGMSGSLERPAMAEALILDGDVLLGGFDTEFTQPTRPGTFEGSTTEPTQVEEVTETKVVVSPPPSTSNLDDSNWTYEDSGVEVEASVTSRLQADIAVMPAAPSVEQEDARPELQDIGDAGVEPADTAETPAVLEDWARPEKPKKKAPKRDTDVMPAVVAPVETPLWRRPSSLLAAGLLSAIVLFLLLYLFGGLDSGPGVTVAGPPSDATSFIGFLSLDVEEAAQVTLDGELVPGSMPMVRHVVKAGMHRLVVKAEDGRPLLDRMLEIKAGKHEIVKLAEDSVPVKVEQKDSIDDTMQQVDSILAKPPAVKAKPRVRKRRRRTRKTRSRRKRKRRKLR